MNYLLFAVIAILVFVVKPFDSEVFSDSSNHNQSDLPCDYSVYFLVEEERMDTIPRNTKFMTIQVVGSEDCDSKAVVIQEMRLYNDHQSYDFRGPKISFSEFNLTSGDWFLEVKKAAKLNADNTFSPTTVQKGTIYIK